MTEQIVEKKAEARIPATDLSTAAKMMLAMNRMLWDVVVEAKPGTLTLSVLSADRVQLLVIRVKANARGNALARIAQRAEEALKAMAAAKGIATLTIAPKSIAIDGAEFEAEEATDVPEAFLRPEKVLEGKNPARFPAKLSWLKPLLDDGFYPRAVTFEAGGGKVTISRRADDATAIQVEFKADAAEARASYNADEIARALRALRHLRTDVAVFAFATDGPLLIRASNGRVEAVDGIAPMVE